MEYHDIPQFIANPNYEEIDFKYIFGRDNYSCNNCQQELTGNQLHIKCIDSQGELVATNYVTSCQKCLQLPPAALPLKSFCGRLIVITGPMYSQKSTTTISYYNKNTVFNKNRIWVKPDIDDRKAGYTKTHDRAEIPATTISALRPDKHLDSLMEYQVIVFDEVQFFSSRIIYLIHQLLSKGKLIIVNGLKLTASRTFFGMMPHLLTEADDIVFLKSVCNVCNSVDTATRTKSFFDGPSVSTGGTSKYFVVCPSCNGGALEEEFLKKSIHQTRV